LLTGELHLRLLATSFLICAKNIKIKKASRGLENIKKLPGDILKVAGWSLTFIKRFFENSTRADRLKV